MHSASLEQLRNATPDEIGRLILPDLARTNPNHGFVPRDYANNLAQRAVPRYGEEQVEYAHLILEGIGFLDRAGMLINNPEQISGQFFRLSRAGVRAAASPSLIATGAVAGQEARTLLHAEIANASLGDFERGIYDQAIVSAFRTLEIRVAPLVEASVHGKDVFYSAFTIGKIRGPLVPATMDNGEATSLRELFAGAFGFLRNPPAHRKVNDDPEQTMRYLLFASSLHYLLDELN